MEIEGVAREFLSYLFKSHFLPDVFRGFLVIISWKMDVFQCIVYEVGTFKLSCVVSA